MTRPLTTRGPAAIALALLTAGLLAGCAGAAEPSAVEGDDTAAAPSAEADDAGASDGIPDPCALLSPDDIEAITGFPVGEGLAEPDRQTDVSSLCEWTQTDDLGTVTVALAPGYPVPYEEGETRLGKTVAIEIPGASEAYSVSDGLSVGMSVDGTYVAVAFSGALDGSRGDVTVELATLVAERLG